MLRAASSMGFSSLNPRLSTEGSKGYAESILQDVPPKPRRPIERCGMHRLAFSSRPQPRPVRENVSLVGGEPAAEAVLYLVTSSGPSEKKAHALTAVVCMQGGPTASSGPSMMRRLVLLFACIKEVVADAVRVPTLWVESSVHTPLGSTHRMRTTPRPRHT